jgi:hypothetical protein
MKKTSIGYCERTFLNLDIDEPVVACEYWGYILSATILFIPLLCISGTTSSMNGCQ